MNFVTLKMGVALHFSLQLANHITHWSDFGVVCKANNGFKRFQYHWLIFLRKRRNYNFRKSCVSFAFKYIFSNLLFDYTCETRNTMPGCGSEHHKCYHFICSGISSVSKNKIQLRFPSKVSIKYGRISLPKYINLLEGFSFQILYHENGRISLPNILVIE